MTPNDKYGSEGERLTPHHDAPEDHYVRITDGGGRNGYVRNFTSIAGLIIQTLLILAALFGFARTLEKRIDTIDAHLTATVNSMQHHVEKDHEERDRSRELLHNTCANAMTKVCHSSR